MGDLITLFGLVIGIIAAESTLDIRAVTINRITISDDISGQWGNTEETLEQKLKDEAYLVMRQARAYEHGSRISTPNADGSIDRVARDAGILRLLQRAQQSLGFLEFTVTGDVFAERGKAVVELRARRYDQQVLRAHMERPMDQMDGLMRDAGWALVRMIDPHIACAALLRKSLLDEKPDPATTLQCIDEAMPVVTDPDRHWLLNLRGVTLTMLGRRTEAFQAFRAALEADRTFGQAWLNVGMLAAAEGRHAEAIQAYRTAIESAAPRGAEQRNAAAAALWAISLEKLGRKDEALIKLREAFRADRNYDLPLRLLIERLPADSAEADDARKILATLDAASNKPDRYVGFTDNIAGMMPVKAFFGEAVAAAAAAR